MGESDVELLTRVTYHAVTCYVQRILHFPPISGSGEDTRECAAVHAAAAGMSIEEVRSRILTRGVRLALTLDAVKVRSPQFVAVIAPAFTGGRTVVISIYARIADRPPMHIPTRAEGQRAANEFSRRARRRPSPSIEPRRLLEEIAP